MQRKKTVFLALLLSGLALLANVSYNYYTYQLLENQYLLLGIGCLALAFLIKFKR